jgi:hypothetical protein
VRADQQLTVRMGGDCFQIACEDCKTIDELTALLKPWIVEGTGLPGFRVSVPESKSGLWILLGSDGAVLARSVDRMPVVRALLRHLSALAAQKGPNAVRLGLRALGGPGGYVLVEPDLLRYKPPIERRLDRLGLRVVDSVFVEVAEGAPFLCSIATEQPSLASADCGHVDASLAAGPVRSVLWPASLDATEPTPGQVAHAFARVARSGSTEERLDFAIDWSKRVSLRLVSPDRGEDILDVAASLLTAQE